MADEKPQAPAAHEQKPVTEPAAEQPSETKTNTVAVESANADESVAPAPAPAAAGETKEAAEDKGAAAADPPKEAPKEDDVSSKPTGPTEAAAPEKGDDASTAKLQSPVQQLYAAFKSQSHPEIWGVTLADPDTHVPSQVIFQKYLNANDANVVKAKDQLLKTLAWRAEAKPLELTKKAFNKAKFEGLGFVTTHGADDDDAGAEKREVFTWNVYGAAAKRLSETFGNTEEFIQWRVALMELGLAALNLPAAKTAITATSDPYKLYQVHDYQSISFLRQPPEVKAATGKVIPLFAQNYPELLKEKFFVNVPALMGFMYSFAKLIVPAKTAKKFHPMSNGAALAGEFAESKVDGLGGMIPSVYGGKGGELKEQGTETLLEEGGDDATAAAAVPEN